MHKSMSHLLLEVLSDLQKTSLIPFSFHFFYFSSTALNTNPYPSTLSITHIHLDTQVVQRIHQWCRGRTIFASLTFPQTARYKDDSQAASQKFVVLMDCIKMSLLVLLSVIISWLWVAQSNTWMQFIQCLTDLLHHDPTSELISFMDFASSAEPSTDI